MEVSTTSPVMEVSTTSSVMEELSNLSLVVLIQVMKESRTSIRDAFSFLERFAPTVSINDDLDLSIKVDNEQVYSNFDVVMTLLGSGLFDKVIIATTTRGDIVSHVSPAGLTELIFYMKDPEPLISSFNRQVNPTILSRFTGLRRLDLSNCKFDTDAMLSISEFLAGLEIIGLKNTDICDRVIVAITGEGSSLEEVDVSHNRKLGVSTLVAFNATPSLRRVVVTGCTSILQMPINGRWKRNNDCTIITMVRK